MKGKKITEGWYMFPGKFHADVHICLKVSPSG